LRILFIHPTERLLAVAISGRSSQGVRLDLDEGIVRPNLFPAGRENISGFRLILGQFVSNAEDLPTVGTMTRSINGLWPFLDSRVP
jgi:hypothetical protein